MAKTKSEENLDFLFETNIIDEDLYEVTKNFLTQFEGGNIIFVSAINDHKNEYGFTRNEIHIETVFNTIDYIIISSIAKVDGKIVVNGLYFDVFDNDFEIDYGTYLTVDSLIKMIKVFAKYQKYLPKK